MADETLPEPAAGAEQLTEVRVPLDETTEAFATRDASGRLPIVVRTERQNRIRNDLMLLAALVLAGGLTAGALFSAPLATTAAVPLALVLAALGVWRAFYVLIPEGTIALLMERGKYARTIGGGARFLPPWVVVSHVVTQREIPYDVPVIEAPSADTVRATVDVLVTFRITDGYRFIYSISADDFDLVLQAACQDVIRALVRRTPSAAIADLGGQDSGDLAAALNRMVEAYGVTIGQVTITYARPPAEFLQIEETRQLAVARRAEQAELQALALRRQADAEELARQRAIAEARREREALQVRLEQAELLQRIAELEATAAQLRLARLEERLSQYPLAARWEAEGAQLDVARALAGNARAVVQLGSLDTLRHLVLVPDEPQHDGASGLGEPQNGARAEAAHALGDTTPPAGGRGPTP